MKEPTTTTKDIELLEKATELSLKFQTEMVQYRTIWKENETNDYPLFLYIASIMNFIESHNEGCLTENGMKSLQLDISPIINQLKEEDSVGQKDYVRFLLNVLNSYATCVLCRGMIEFSKENPSAFFELNNFPSAIREDFDNLEQRINDLVPKLKQILDTYSNRLEKKYLTIFTKEKQNGFKKPIFDITAIRLDNGPPTNLANARECR